MKLTFSSVGALALLALTLAARPASAQQSLNIETATIADLEAAMANGSLTSEKLTQAYMDRIAAFDQQGPNINAVIYANPKALETARQLDAERRAGHVRGPLHGIPIILKDNYNTFDLPTTVGCQLLDGSYPPADAFVVDKLRRAGVVILAKVNLSEFAGGGSIGPAGGAAARRSDAPPAPLPTMTSPRHGPNIPGAQSTQGGLTVNPHDITKSPSGSSGGTGAGIAAVFAQFGMGSDTGGSIRGPCSFNGIAGLKPTRGLLSRSGIAPLALSYDTGGPMARSVYDVAAALGVMVGVDPTDSASLTSAGQFTADYTKFLKVGALKGARIGILRDFFGVNEEVDHIMEASIAKLHELGATTVDIKLPPPMFAARNGLSTLVIEAEFKAQIADYLATLKPGYPKSLAELAARAADPESHYRNDNKRDGLKRNDEHALALTDPIYLAAKNEGLAFIKATIMAEFAQHHLTALIYPTSPRPATPIGITGGGGGMTSNPWNIANETGFPDLIVPAGMTKDGLPVTISFFGLAYSEPTLLAYGYDFEQATHALRLPKYTPALPTDVVN